MMTSKRSLKSFSRWWLVVVSAGVIGMAGTYQFVWSSIRTSLGDTIGASGTTLGTLFTLLIIAQTLAQFPAGRFRDRHGPRLPLLVGAILLASGYAGLAVAPSPAAAMLAVISGGIGAGAVYTVAVNTPVKWFRAYRSLATSAVTMAYGGLSVLFIPAVRSSVAETFPITVLALGGLSGIICLIGVLVLRDPDHETDPDSRTATKGVETASPTVENNPIYTWREVVQTWQFWLLYAVFAVVNGVGLMLIAKVVVFAESLGLSAAAATNAASIVALAGGVGIVIVGGASDWLGKIHTAGASLVLSGLSIVVTVVMGEHGFARAFVIFVGAAAFFRSPVFSIFPSLMGDYYGTPRSSENYAVLYTAKVWGGVFGGTATSLLVASFGWGTTFLLGGCLLAFAGLVTFLIFPVDRI